MVMNRSERPSVFQRRVKAWTVAVTAVTVVSLVVFDWDKAHGHETVFSGIRPALRNVLNRLYGVDPPARAAPSPPVK